jgi:hypothetical protein
MAAAFRMRWIGGAGNFRGEACGGLKGTESGVGVAERRGGRGSEKNFHPEGATLWTQDVDFEGLDGAE